MKATREETQIRDLKDGIKATEEDFQRECKGMAQELKEASGKGLSQEARWKLIKSLAQSTKTLMKLHGSLSYDELMLKKLLQ